MNFKAGDEVNTEANDIKTTLRYLHTSNKDLLKIISPLDDLQLT